MVISYYNSAEGYISNDIRTKKINNGFLITTDFGSWAYLNDEEFRQLKANTLKEPLLGFLKEKGIIVSESNVSSIIDKFRHNAQYSFQGVSFHAVYPSVDSNKKIARTMSKHTAKKIADFILQSASSASVVQFQSNDLQAESEIITYIIDYLKMKNDYNTKNLKFNILGDLTSMSNEILDLSIRENISLYTYFDGCAEVHEKNWGNYDQVFHWIKEITKKYKLNCITIASKNSLDYHTKMIDGFASLGLDSFELTPFYNDAHMFKLNNGVSSNDFLKFWKQILDYLVAINKKNFLAEASTRRILKSIVGEAYIGRTESPFNAISKLAYTCDGEVFYTDKQGNLHDIFRLGSVDDEYFNLLSSKTAEGIVRASLISNPIHETSAFGPYYSISPINAFAENGNIIEKFPNKRSRIIEGMFSHVFEKLLFDEEFSNMFLKWIDK